MKEETIMFKYNGVLYAIVFTPTCTDWSSNFTSDDVTFNVHYKKDHNEIRVYSTYETIGGWVETNTGNVLFTKNIN
jgi:surface antigen